MLQLADLFFTLLHLAIIAFNLFGWIWPVTRKAHFISVLTTAGSWFILGIWFGWGYCPITDWQWAVKAKLGEKHLPRSFIDYYGEKISNSSLNDSFVDIVTLIAFLMVVILSVYFNFFKNKNRRSAK